MSYKSILVHLDTSTRAHTRLEIALSLARQFGARLTGLFAIYTPEPCSFYVMAGSAEYFADHARARRERRGAIERLFHAELARANVPGAWIDAEERANQSVSRYARCADLVIAGQSDPNDPEAYVDDHFPETLAMSSGRPVLLVPFAGQFPVIGSHALVAWDGSAESTRAVHDALPFLARADATTLLTVNGALTDPPGSRMPGADIAATLARHGARVEVRNVGCEPHASIGDVLLSHASESGADLLVMGAYGHTRWHEMVLGGATRTVLASMSLPVLMSH